METFEKALQIVLDAGQASLLKQDFEQVALEDACGRVLQQPVMADRDMPPFDKSAVDGYACKSVDLERGGPMRLLEVVAAGAMPLHQVMEGCCVKVMTGAMVPEGTECVLMVEEAWEVEGAVCCAGKSGRKTNICVQGEDLAMGAQVLDAGIVIQSQHIALLAAMGYARVQVAAKIKVGVISTGDELVEPWESPQAAQIRNSNSWQLMAQCRAAGALATYYGIAKDSVDSFAPVLAAAIKENDGVIVSGGVSMGDFDIVPQTAQSLGINILFDRVAVQPGKPTTFGVGAECFFFGLPGNPVSSFIQFELMVKPFLMGRMGAHYAPLLLRLPLSHPFTRKQAERMAHLPAVINPVGSCTLIDYHGSGHITALDRAQGIVRIPLGVTSVSAGTHVEVILL